MPTATRTTNAPRKEDGKSTVASEGRILVADDDASILRLCSELLRSAGFEVDEAADGAAAARLLKGSTFDAIVSDIAMPNMNGLALLKHVRERDPRLPVVLMTGFPAVETAVK